MLILRNPAHHSDNRDSVVFFGAECRCGWTTKVTDEPLEMIVQQLAHTKRSRHTQFWEYVITRYASSAALTGHHGTRDNSPARTRTTA
jgi:hypothetical protein